MVQAQTCALSPALTGLRVALVHDSFTQWGGAERVVAALHGLFPQAPVYTIAVDRRTLADGLEKAEFRTSFLQNWPGMPTLSAYRRYLPLLPAAAQALRPTGFDLVISSSSSFAHGASAEPARHIAYIHNTMRFAWDYAGYVDQLAWPAALRLTGRVGAAWLRRWDRRAASRPAHLIANSRAVARRIRRRWGRAADVLPPPVSTGAIPLGGAVRHHFCVVSRLLPYKRIDLAIAAANAAGERLLVIGDGPDLPRLRTLAGPTVEFLGRVDDPTKATVLATAFALLTPGVEDFGIAPVEANAAGTPVIAQADGGVLETQIGGRTALLVREPTAEAFADAMRRARAQEWDRQSLRRHAERFSPESFRRGLDALLLQHLGLTAQAPRPGPRHRAPRPV